MFIYANSIWNIRTPETVQNKYKESLNVKEDTKVISKFGMDDLIKLLKRYWYVILIVLCVSIGFVVIIKINKKRGDLV